MLRKILEFVIQNGSLPKTFLINERNRDAINSSFTLSSLHPSFSFYSESFKCSINSCNPCIFLFHERILEHILFREVSTRQVGKLPDGTLRIRV